MSDLADAHVKALKMLAPGSGLNIYNIGTGNGTSVFELVHDFEQASGETIPYVIDGRRPGDVPAVYCSAEKAEKELGWKAERSVMDACRGAWKWQKFLDSQKKAA